MENKAIETECVEPCPYCGKENIYQNYDAAAHGYKAFCQECGAEIMLCDECLHADDNPGGRCDWHELYGKLGDEVRGICFRGITKHKEG